MTSYFSQLLRQTGLQLAPETPLPPMSSGEPGDTTAPLDVDIQRTIEPQLQPSIDPAPSSTTLNPEATVVIPQRPVGTEATEPDWSGPNEAATEDGPRPDAAAPLDIATEDGPQPDAAEPVDVAAEDGPQPDAAEPLDIAVEDGPQPDAAEPLDIAVESRPVDSQTRAPAVHGQKEAVDEATFHQATDLVVRTVELTPAVPAAQPKQDDRPQTPMSPAASQGPSLGDGEAGPQDAQPTQRRGATLDEVREWVSTTPTAADRQDSGVTAERPEERATLSVAPLPETGAVSNPLAERQRQTRTEVQDLHLSIGTISITLEEPPNAQEAAAHSLPKQTARPLAQSRGFSRLSRHYLKIR